MRFRPTLALVGLFAALLSASGPRAQLLSDDFETGEPYIWFHLLSDQVDYLHPSLLDPSAFYTGTPGECSHNPPTPDWTGPYETIDPSLLPDGSQVALFVVVHVERSTPWGDPAVFARGVAELDAMADLFESHGARLSVHLQDPFLDLVAANADPILVRLAGAGHALGVHFHEDEQLGGNANQLEPAVWAARLSALKTQVESLAAGLTTVRGMSGGNLYPRLFEAMSLAGLGIKMNYKVPGTQLGAAAAMTVTPYRPGSWGSPEAIAHGGGESIVFLPAGVYPLHCTAAEGVNSPRSPAPFDYVTRALRHSLEVSRPDEIQVHGVVFSLARLDPALVEAQIGLWRRWLGEVLDPLAASGHLRFGTTNGLAAEVEARLPPAR